MNAPVKVLPAMADQERAFGRATSGAAGLSVEPLPFFTPAALWEGHAPSSYLCKRMVEPRGVTTIFGDQGTYKSTLSIALAAAMGTGESFYGIRTRKAGVLYLAGEGCAGMRKRLRALMMDRGLTAADPEPLMAITEAPANLICNAEQLRATVEKAAKQLGVPIEVIFCDTLAANFGQGEENSATDMALAIANAKRAAPDAGLVIVHHSGHGTGERERGSSSLPFGADFRFRTSYDKASRIVRLDNLKQKDDECQPPIFFEPRRFGVEWLDCDGEELTSIVLDRVAGEPDMPRYEAKSQRRARGMGENQETLLKLLKRLYRQHRKNLEQENRVPSEAKVMLDGLRNEAVPKHMDRHRYVEALSGLEKRELIRIEGPLVFLQDKS